MLRVLLDLIQSLSVHSKFGPLQQLVQALSGCVDFLHLLDRFVDGLIAPFGMLIVAHLLNESGELVLCTLVVHVILGGQQAPANVDDEAALIGGPTSFRGRWPVCVVVEVTEVVLLSDLVVALLLGDILAQQIVGITKRAPA